MEGRLAELKVRKTIFLLVSKANFASKTIADATLLSLFRQVLFYMKS